MTPPADFVHRFVPAANVEALAAMLREAGARATLHWSDAGHQLASPEIADARRWLADCFPA